MDAMRHSLDVIQIFTYSVRGDDSFRFRSGLTIISRIISVSFNLFLTKITLGFVTLTVVKLLILLTVTVTNISLHENTYT